MCIRFFQGKPGHRQLPPLRKWYQYQASNVRFSLPYLLLGYTCHFTTLSQVLWTSMIMLPRNRSLAFCFHGHLKCICFLAFWTLRLIFDHSEICQHPSTDFKVYSSEKAMAPNSTTLAWKIPWMEKPGRLQSMGSQRVGHDWMTSLSLFTFMHWRRKWQPTPVFLPGESQRWGSLVGCCLWVRTESDTTEVTLQQQQHHNIIEIISTAKYCDESSRNGYSFLKTDVFYLVRGFPDSAAVKNLPVNAGKVGLIPGSGRSPGVGKSWTQLNNWVRTSGKIPGHFLRLLYPISSSASFSNFINVSS